MISIKEASALLGVTPTTLRNWEESGKLKPVRPEGGHRRYVISDLIMGKKEKALTIA
jgi:excisionase family DNA binding protein